jgi:hypothetical protein
MVKKISFGINEALKEKIEGKYQEMKKKGLIEDTLDFDPFKGLKIFINRRTNFPLIPSLKFGEDTVYIGSETLY